MKASERIRAAAVTMLDGEEFEDDKAVPLDLALREVEELEARLAKMREALLAAQAIIIKYDPIRLPEGIVRAAERAINAALAAEPAGEKEQDGKE